MSKPHPVLPALLLVAATAAAGPTAVVEVGFDGLVRPGRPLHVRAELENKGPDWTGTLRVEEWIGERVSTTWQWPVSIPSGGRRVRFVTLTPAVLGQAVARADLRASLVGETEPESLSFRLLRGGHAVFVALTLTDRGTGYSAVRDALDPPGPTQGQVDVHVPAIVPEEAPPDPAAWEVVDAIVIDLAVADRIDAPAWEAIRTRVAQGASLLVHGVGGFPDLMPEDLIPARQPAGARVDRWQEPGALIEHSMTRFELLEGATRPQLDGDPLPFAASKRFGAGRSTVAGVDLRNLRAPTATQAPLWGELLGLPAPGQADAIRPIDQVPMRVQDHALARRSFGTRSLAFLLGLTALLCVAALVVARSLSRSEGLVRLAPLLGVGAALPLLAIGTVSRLVEDREPFVIEEHFEALGRTRTTTVLDPTSSSEHVRRLPLAGWPVRLLPPGVGSGRPMDLVLEGGSEPAALGLRPASFPGLTLQAESWAETAQPPFRLELSSDGVPFIRNVSGRELSDVHVLVQRSVYRLGDLADGEGAAVNRQRPAFRDSPAARALTVAEGRLPGFGVAGVVTAPGGGVLARPISGTVVAWLEPLP